MPILYQYKLIALNRSIVVSGANDGLKLTDEHRLLTALMCPPSENASGSSPDAACMLGSCRSCNNYEAAIHEHYADLDKAVSCTWNMWERVQSEDGRSRKQLDTTQSTVGQAVEEPISNILHPVQGTCYPSNDSTMAVLSTQLKKNLPASWSLMVMDFGKNRGVRYQDEIKAAYYAQAEITMHPVVAYFRDGDNNNNNLFYIASNPQKCS